MSLASRVSKLIGKYGTRVTLSEGDIKTETRAVIQPLMYKNKMYIGSDIVPLGFLDKGHYLMVAPSDIPVKNYRKLVIFDGDKGYTVKRSEAVKVGDEVIYIWAVLTVYADEMEDEYEDD